MIIPNFIDPTNIKTEQQINAYRLWKKNGYVGTDVWVTGAGKTNIGLICSLNTQKDISGASTIVVVPSIQLEEQWTNLFEKWGIKNYTVITYSYITHLYKKEEILECELLILDEIHRSAADQFRKVFEVVKYKRLKGLTATLERLDGKHELIEGKAPVLTAIPFERALQLKIISPFTIYKLGVDLTPSELRTFRYLTDTMSKKFNFFQKWNGMTQWDVAMTCLRGRNVFLTPQQIKEANGDMNYIPPGVSADHISRNRVKGVGYQFLRRSSKKLFYREKFHKVYADNYNEDPDIVAATAKQWMDTMQARRKLIANSKVKVDYAERIVSKFSDVKCICFSESVDFATDLAERAGGFAYHSKVPKKKLEKNLEAFKKGEIKLLSTVKALDEGYDDPDLRLSIITSFTNSARQAVQRNGRVARLSEGKNRAVSVYIYFKDTHEANYKLDKALAKLPNFSIEEIGSIEEIEL